MARKELTVVCPLEGRDNGTVFHIKEMSASDAEDWGGQVGWLILQFATPSKTPMSPGMAGVAENMDAVVGPQPRIPYSEIRPLLDRLMACVTIGPDKARPDWFRPLAEEDIQEFDTRVWLKREVLNLHVNFFTIGRRLASAFGLSTNLASAIASWNTSTSPLPSEPAYRPARQVRQNSRPR